MILERWHGNSSGGDGAVPDPAHMMLTQLSMSGVTQ